MSEQVDEAELAVLDEDGVELVDADENPDQEAGTAPDTARKKLARKKLVRKKRRRRPVKRATIWVHRWVSLVLGLVLVVITTSGALLLYNTDYQHWTNRDVYSVKGTSTPMPLSEAIDIVDRAHPDFRAGNAIDERGLYKVQSFDPAKHPGFYGVDPADGRITGYLNTSSGVMGLLVQVHDCFFTCENNIAYASWMAATPFGEVTWGALVLGTMGLVLVFLALSGIWLWYPTIRTWRHGFRVRWKKGRYARDYDLHQVVGMAAVPFLLMWGLTGANFEFPFVGNAWYAVTGGQKEAEEAPFVSDAAKAKQPAIGIGAATDAAEKIAGPDSTLVYVSHPDPDDPTATYYFYFGKGFDTYTYGSFPGDYGVAVDQHDATRTHVDDFSDAPTWSNQVLDVWADPVGHMGYGVNGGWRLIWFGFGLTPLFLAVTGVSTWLAKRSVRKRRKQLTAAAVDAGSAGNAGNAAAPSNA